MADIHSHARGFNEKLIVPRIRESTFGTEAGFGTAADTFNYACKFSGDAPRVHQESDTDRDVANGYRHGVTEHPRERSTPATFELPASLDAIAHFFTMLGGADTVSTPSGGGAADRVHSIPRSAITTGAHPFGYQCNYDGWTVGSKDIRAIGNQVKSLELSAGRTGFGSLKIETYGSGRTGTPATTDGTNPYSGGIAGSALWIPAAKFSIAYIVLGSEHTGYPTAPAYTASSTQGVTANLSGYDATFGQELNDWTLRIDNALDEDKAYSSGQNSGAGIFGGRAPVGEAENITFTANLLTSNNTATIHESILNTTSTNNVEYALGIEVVLDQIGTNRYLGMYIPIPIMRIVPTPAWNRSRGLRTIPVTWEVKSDTANDLLPIYLFVMNQRTSAYGATS